MGGGGRGGQSGTRQERYEERSWRWHSKAEEGNKPSHTHQSTAAHPSLQQHFTEGFVPGGATQAFNRVFNWNFFLQRCEFICLSLVLMSQTAVLETGSHCGVPRWEYYFCKRAFFLYFSCCLGKNRNRTERFKHNGTWPFSTVVFLFWSLNMKNRHVFFMG